MTPPDRPVNYAELMHVAGRNVADAAVAVSQQRIPDTDSARLTIASYWSLLGAIHRHAWLLAGGPRRMQGLTASANLSQLDSAVVEFIDALAVARKHHSPPSPDAVRTVAGQAWAQATRCVGGAADLLSTHRDEDGQWRSPDAAQIEAPAVQDAAMLGLANIADVVLAAQRDLCLHVGQAGVAWAEVGRLLPDPGVLLTSTRRVLAVEGADPGGRRVLEDLGVARPKIRTSDPLTELGDRILRLRRTAWQLSREPHIGAACLSDFAAAGVIFHTYAGQQGSPSRLADGATTAEAGRSAWSLAHLRLRELRTATPGLSVVHADVLGIRDTCRVLMTQPGGELSDVGEVLDPRQRATVIAGGIRAFADVAGSSIEMVDHLWRTEQLYVSGRQLTGDQVTDDPYLVEAKLDNHLVLAPQMQVQPSIDALKAARSAVPRRSRLEPCELERGLAISP